MAFAEGRVGEGRGRESRSDLKYIIFLQFLINYGGIHFLVINWHSFVGEPSTVHVKLLECVFDIRSTLPVILFLRKQETVIFSLF